MVTCALCEKSCKSKNLPQGKIYVSCSCCGEYIISHEAAARLKNSENWCAKISEEIGLTKDGEILVVEIPVSPIDPLVEGNKVALEMTHKSRLKWSL